MSEKKTNYLDEAVGRIAENLKKIVSFVESDEEEMKDLEAFFGVIREELLQSFKNGIGVEKERASGKSKEERGGTNPYEEV
ncbi:hypothetical protein ACFL4G_11355 [Thermodesulfobacteriota bacterium]